MEEAVFDPTPSTEVQGEATSDDDDNGLDDDDDDDDDDYQYDDEDVRMIINKEDTDNVHRKGTVLLVASLKSYL